MKNLKFSEIIRLNSNLEQLLEKKERVELRVLSNITINQVNPILEYCLRDKGLNAHVTVGNYDNIVQESLQIDSKQIYIVFWEVCNIKESFVYEIESTSEEIYLSHLSKIKDEINIFFNNMANARLVIFNKFSHLPFTYYSLRQKKIEIFVNEINKHIEKIIPQNFFSINLDKIFAKLSLDSSLDMRNYYNAKALYSVDFLKSYVKHISPVIFSIYGLNKKALIFDCDNTLWKGIVGEDGWEHLEMSEKNKNGVYFKNVQLVAKDLQQRGVILGLCSKNNFEDVDEVFINREDMVIHKDDFLVSKINWNDKASNLSEIALELNIGIDSLVFVDDSDFELNLVNEKLPSVKTYCVPEKLYNYPGLFNEITNSFFSLNVSVEDANRNKMYRENIERKKNENSFTSIDDYLASLNIELEFSNKDIQVIERIAQLTQKTNQFNITTKRYSVGDIQSFYDSMCYDVICVEVKDKFGNFGITGLSIIKYEEDYAVIDTFLMSCRIIGRNIENVFLQEIIETIKNRGYKNVHAQYLKTQKNKLVENFYERNGFLLQSFDDSKKNYEGIISDLFKKQNAINYIKIKWKKK